jgi:hypothetical protein
MPRAESNRLRDLYLPPPVEGMTLESAVLTTYKVDWTFLEEDILAPALAVRSPVSREAAFRSELERRLSQCEVTVLYDLRAAEREAARLSPRIDAIPTATRKLHAKISLLMWSAPGSGGAPRKHARVIVGSANLTRPGFRENYEVVAALDYGERSTAPPRLLRDAVALVRNIAKESQAPRLAAQLTTFERFSDGLGASEADDQPWRLVEADNLVSGLEEAWRPNGRSRPRSIVIASPFWPEGDDPAAPVVELIRRFGRPEQVSLVCQATGTAVAGAMIPVIPAALARDLQARLGCDVVLQPSRWDFGVDAEDEQDTGETSEDDTIAPGVSQAPSGRRSLHAKIIAVRGQAGSVLYVGSSNCTRRGIGLAAKHTAAARTNWEAGLIYRLPAKRAGVIDELLRFAGPPIPVRADRPVPTEEPKREPDAPAPVFLEEVVANGSEITVRFRPGQRVPSDLVLLMPDQRDRDRFWLLWRRATSTNAESSVRIALETCPAVDQALDPVASEPFGPAAMSSWIEVRWERQVALFPVRFDDKETLPRVLGARRLTESELIDYFLYGREPWESGNGTGGWESGDETLPVSVEVDTRRILSYFIRRFVEAIPGIEDDIARAWYSRPVLLATLTGPTGVLALAAEAAGSLRQARRPNEPVKTPTAVGFQLVEIIAALLRCRERAPTDEAREVLDDAIRRCRAMLTDVARDHPELPEGGFASYWRRFDTERV